MAPSGNKKTLFIGSACIGLAVLTGCLAMFSSRGSANGSGDFRLKDLPVDGERAYGYLVDMCRLGRRFSGSPGMIAQRKMLIDHFRDLGAEVKLQKFDERHPLDGSRVEIVNIVVHWHPERQERVLLCAHYDTRPYPDQDPRQPRGLFVGANDGASGVAVLMELGHHMSKLNTPLGVDFVLFDAEEFIFDPRDRDRYFIGSTYFARTYQADPPPYKYRWGVLLDMVGDKELHLYQERNSVRWRETRPLVNQIWDTAKELGVRDFVPRVRHEVRDDHLPLRNIGGIPTCNIIDFDYPRPGARSYWHTQADTPDKCSPLSLAKVGWVLLHWLEHLDP